MEFVVITAVGGFVAFFFYHRVIITRIETSMINFEAELDYMEDVVMNLRKQCSELESMVAPRSQVKKSFKRKRGRPMNPNSIRQKKLRGEN